ncbi:hypothetical protein H6G33_31750 [Calothrix sp. FACHB-1219]|uniref:hypothetical protein n=1 Tax=unclassified Calothrix TaxID=2619626 RepID=UPI00168827F0|nr:MULTISPECIES: hypothetical protein [unclassified Calothrix]MBD2206927.1 hypothetical protein [Calothrix sp. FACHB-168]MBD2221545.1 hypothetical protein [Calothrix sp. FACHB-1219]
MSNSSNTTNQTPANSTITNLQNALEQAKNKDKIFDKFLKEGINAGSTAEKLAILYRGVETSPYLQDINNYPERLKQQPNPEDLIFKPYPKVGEMPQIDRQGLEFIHSDIKEACICIGRVNEGKIKAHWLGRNALNKNQFWSGTKIIPLLNIVSQANTKFFQSSLENCVIRDPAKRQKDTPFLDIASDIISYKEKVASSNSLAAMCKRFETWEGLEAWVKKVTGNQDLVFRGRYGEDPFINQPELFDLNTKKVLLSAAPETTRGDNLVTAYDLLRLLTMLGWHHQLPVEARLPGAQWHSLSLIVKALGKDACRYTDIAIDTLGLKNYVSSPVIISKLGDGYSDSRKSTEIVYLAFMQFILDLPQSGKKPADLITLGLALRGAKPFQETNPAAIEQAKNRDAVELDARMVTEVTEILRRVVTQELV